MRRAPSAGSVYIPHVCLVPEAIWAPTHPWAVKMPPQPKFLENPCLSLRAGMIASVQAAIAHCSFPFTAGLLHPAGGYIWACQCPALKMPRWWLRARVGIGPPSSFMLRSLPGYQRDMRQGKSSHFSAPLHPFLVTHSEWCTCTIVKKTVTMITGHYAPDWGGPAPPSSLPLPSRHRTFLQ